jgi:hypothetical protein
VGAVTKPVSRRRPDSCWPGSTEGGYSPCPVLCVGWAGYVAAVGVARGPANGDVVNKVGTYPHALGAKRAGIPFCAVAPESTVDSGTPTELPYRSRTGGATRRLGSGGPYP